MFWQQLSVIGELRTLLVWNLVVSEAVYLWWSKRKTHKMIETLYHHYQPVNFHCWLEAFLLECQDEWTWPASIHQLPATATMTYIFWVERRHKNHLINSNKLSWWYTTRPKRTPTRDEQIWKRFTSNRHRCIANRNQNLSSAFTCLFVRLSKYWAAVMKVYYQTFKNNMYFEGLSVYLDTLTTDL